MAQTVLIQNVTTIDVENATATPGQYILIRDGLIQKISDRPISAANATLIEGSNTYVLPGFIDTHIHFFQTGSLYTRPDALDMTAYVPYEKEMAFAQELAFDSFKRYLRLGITTVMDVGGPFQNFKVRDQMATTTVAPNVLVTGPLFSPYQPKAFAKLEDQPIAKITSIADADALFDQMLPKNPDFIKIWYIDSPETPAAQFFPIAQHIAQRAHQNNLKLAVHATQLKTARLAVKAGADILVHSVDDQRVDMAFAKALKDKDVLYIPTLIVSNNYIKAFAAQPADHPQDLAFANPKAYGSLKDVLHYSEQELPAVIPMVRDNFEMLQQRNARKDSIMFNNLKFLVDQGVRIATGTDAGNIGTMHAASYLQELELMQQSGLTLPQILKASTIDAAHGFGLAHKLGSIKEGKQADLVLYRNNPLEALAHLNSMTHTIVAGKVLAVSSLIQETPEQIVQRQLNAYNARDIEAFLNTYADDIELYNFPDELRSKGKQAMREGYASFFENTKDLHCEIKNRIVLGNKVIDQEYITANGNNFGAVAIYEVDKGKIVKVTFL